MTTNISAYAYSKKILELFGTLTTGQLPYTYDIPEHLMSNIRNLQHYLHDDFKMSEYDFKDVYWMEISGRSKTIAIGLR